MAVIEGQESFPGMPQPLFAASPSRLLAFQDCPRRYRFQYLDRPTLQRRSQRAHTSLGIAVRVGHDAAHIAGAEALVTSAAPSSPTSSRRSWT